MRAVFIVPLLISTVAVAEDAPDCPPAQFVENAVLDWHRLDSPPADPSRNPPIIMELAAVGQSITDVNGERGHAWGSSLRAGGYLGPNAYIGAELTGSLPDLEGHRALLLSMGERAYLSHLAFGGFGGASLNFGALRLRTELFVGRRTLSVSIPTGECDCDGGEQVSSRALGSDFVLQPRAGAELWLGQRVTLGVLAGWSPGLVTGGLTFGFHAKPRDGQLSRRE